LADLEKAKVVAKSVLIQVRLDWIPTKLNL